MGFIDLSGSLGRHFGSIGVALNEISTRMTMTSADHCSVTGPSAERAECCLGQLCKVLGVSDKLNIAIEAAIPEHVGLGSGTQMALAVGLALSQFYCLKLSVRDVAAITERGQRSGIGIGVFEQGGLVVDGGRGPQTITPPMLAQMPIPDSWRFILVLDQRGQGLHGQQEVLAFKKLPPFPRQEAEHLCYLLLMQGLPALAERDIGRFGEVITHLQRSVGEHFAPAQGGIFTSPEVAEAIAWLAGQGAVALGQTSWGPTGFCMVDGEGLAEVLTAKARQQFEHYGNLSFITVSARNTGGSVQVVGVENLPV